jgi:hypothetical protein
MARHEADREDLMSEATALVRRAELRVAGEELPVTAGVRDSGRLSIYFGSDPVYHFDEQNRLRRAFVDGLLYRTQGSFLAELTRHRTPQIIELRRQDLAGASLDEFLARMRRRLELFRDAFARGEVEVLRQVPEEDDFAAELSDRIARILESPEPLAPAIQGKRN